MDYSLDSPLHDYTEQSWLILNHLSNSQIFYFTFNLTSVLQQSKRNALQNLTSIFLRIYLKDFPKHEKAYPSKLYTETRTGRKEKLVEKNKKKELKEIRDTDVLLFVT